MKSNYRRIGNIIRLVDERNTGLKVQRLLGLSISKQFIPSVANIIGTDMENYKIIRKNQFACSTMQVRRDKKMPVALLQDIDEAIISQAYPVFEVKDRDAVLPEYLMMWFSRQEFDREACFYAIGGVRGSLEWEDFCDMQLPIPSIEKQKEIVKEYHTIIDRIKLNNQLIQKLEETAQAVYKQWFVDFEFPNRGGVPYKANGGEMVESELGEIPKRWKVGTIGDYSKVKSGFAFKSEWWQMSGIPVIKIGSICNNTIDYQSFGYVSKEVLETTPNYKAQKGDIVIAMTGATIGKIGLLPKLNTEILVNQRVGLFDLGNEPSSKNPFLYLTLLTDFVQNEIKNVGGDSAQANVSNKQIENIKTIIPSALILTSFNQITKSLVENILMKIQENILLDMAKDILLSKLATMKN